MHIPANNANSRCDKDVSKYRYGRFKQNTPSVKQLFYLSSNICFLF